MNETTHKFRNTQKVIALAGIFGALAGLTRYLPQGLPSFSTGVKSSKRQAPQHIQDWYIEQAKEKRARRALKRVPAAA